MCLLHWQAGSLPPAPPGMATEIIAAHIYYVPGAEPNMLLEENGEIAPERMKRLSQSRNDTQLWMCLVVNVKSDSVKNNIAQESRMLGP